LIETLRLLDANSLTPATLTVREPSLDDAFLALTGRRAEGGDGETGGDPSDDGEAGEAAAERPVESRSARRAA
jgi:hypothetical protein